MSLFSNSFDMVPMHDTLEMEVPDDPCYDIMNAPANVFSDEEGKQLFIFCDETPDGNGEEHCY